MDVLFEALRTGAGMLWKALWGLLFGYTISAAIQVLVTREQMAKALGERGLGEAGLAGFFGFVSSSCSFAALAASRSILVKGAHPANSLAFLVASTNLVIELGIVLWLLVGWKFTLANFALGIVMIAYAYALTALWFPRKLAGRAAKIARRAQAEEGMSGEALGRRSWRAKLGSIDGWASIARAFVMEWRMVWREILFGFAIAGFISVWVPDAFWNALFVGESDRPSFLAVLQNAAVAPVVAFFTFIGSMGNVPLAAMLWSKGTSFGGVMAFLGADLVAGTVVWVHAKYYGWRYAGYLSLLLYVCMVAAGVTVHYCFAAFGALPTERPSLEEMVRFGIDHTLVLNAAFGALAAWLVYLHVTHPAQSRRGAARGA